MCEEDRYGERRGRRTGAAVPASGAVVISSPEELVASVPSILGFTPPEDSLVLLCGETTTGRPGPVIRVDVPGLLRGHDGFVGEPPGCEADPELDPGPGRFLADYCERHGVLSAHLVLVHERCAEDPEAALRARDAAEAVTMWLSLAGTAVPGAVGVGAFRGGEPWIDLGDGRIGEQMDPDATHLAAVYALEGRVRQDSREDVAELYRTRDADACDAETGRRPSDRIQSRTVDRWLRRHDALVRVLAEGGTPDEAELAAVAGALRAVPIRDALVAELAARPLADDDPRRDLWWAIARRRPPTERSIGLTLLGAGSYFDGGGVHAAAALTAACEADPANRLARLMLQAVLVGIDPEEVRGSAG